MKDFTVSGYVTKNIETRQTQSGKHITSFSVNAPNYDRNTQESTPQFFSCEYWHNGDQDDKARNIQEGALLLLWGQLRFNSWQTQDGQNRSRMLLNVREIGVIRPPKNQGYQQPQYAPQYTPQPAYQTPQPIQQQTAPQQLRPVPQSIDPYAEDDIPF